LLERLNKMIFSESLLSSSNLNFDAALSLLLFGIWFGFCYFVIYQMFSDLRWLIFV